MSESSISVNLHPLPILNISDHTNRSRLAGGGKAIGALLGSIINRQVAVVNSFEIILRDGLLDVEFLETRREQFKQVFPTLEVVGWYSSGSSPSDEDVRIHQKFCEVVDVPIFMLFTGTGNDLPVLIFESAVDQSNFIPLPFGIETGEAERIAVEGVTVGNMGGGSDDDAVIGNLSTQRNAIKMLSDRIRVLLDYINNALLSGGDSAILQQISSISSALPAITGSGFQTEFLKDRGDVDLTKYLALLTKQLSALNDYADKHNVVYPAVVEGGGASGGGGGVGGGRPVVVGGRRR